ncbi:hypothetical protein C9E91_11360 [Rhizobium sp. SEMIA4064]|nr:hypothetical protein C9E91_11360 [Rhizobium sp. SEMIA4064]
MIVISIDLLYNGFSLLIQISLPAIIGIEWRNCKRAAQCSRRWQQGYQLFSAFTKRVWDQRARSAKPQVHSVLCEAMS